MKARRRLSGEKAIEAVVEDSAVGLIGTGEGNDRPARGGDEQDIGGGVGFRWSRWDLLPALRPRARREEGDPLAIGGEDGRAGVGLVLLHRPGLVAAALDEPERLAVLPGLRVDPGADVGEAFPIGRE